MTSEGPQRLGVRDVGASVNVLVDRKGIASVAEGASLVAAVRKHRTTLHDFVVRVSGALVAAETRHAATVGDVKRVVGGTVVTSICGAAGTSCCPSAQVVHTMVGCEPCTAIYRVVEIPRGFDASAHVATGVSIKGAEGAVSG